MTSERWRRIEDLYHAALEHAPEEWPGFLAGACAGDTDLVHEVESLLARNASGERGGHILDEKLSGVAADLLSGAERLQPGAVVGPYRIIERLGAGGMGEVYRAADTRLARDVALKLLPADQLADPERRRRFLSEARAASALNHPHIVTFYDLLSAGAEDLLVLECVPGRTLDQLIGKRGLRLRDALTYAVQIADGLAAAHQAGIVHRDLKPQNVIASDQGTVKILDFGLAKFTGGKGEAEQSETLPSGDGRIVGTVVYMSPEQAEGRKVDARSDIFSFGVVLYEMLTGRRVFQRDTTASTLAAILRDEFEPVEGIPEGLRKLLARCLRKDPARRIQSAADIRVALEEIAEECERGTAASRPPKRPKWTWAAAAIALMAAALAGWFRRPPQPPATRNWTLSLGEIRDAVLSPDGGSALYRDGRGLILRRLDSTTEILLRTASPLRDTPAWSPDGSQVLFRNGQGLIRMRLPDGPSAVIWPDAPTTRGFGWGPDGDILVAVIGEDGKAAIHLLPQAGGTPVALEFAGLKDNGRFYEPEFLPQGGDFLFAWAAEGKAEAGLYLATLKRGKVVRGPLLLRRNATAGHFSPSGGGRLLYVQDDNLYAQTLNVPAGKVEGEPQRVVQGVASLLSTRHALFSVSRDRLLAWTPGKAALAQLTWFDRRGKVLDTAGPPSAVGTLSLSPDEKHLLLTGGHQFTQILEPHGSGVTPLAGIVGALWMPDNAHVLYQSRGDERVLERDLASGSDREVTHLSGVRSLRDVSSDGKTLIYSADRKTYAVSIAGPAGADKPRVISDNGVIFRFSPDGKWIALVTFAADSRSPEIFVQPFAFAGLRQQVSANGATDPVWRGDGKEILYRSGSKLYAVRMDAAGHEIRAGTPQVLFDVRVPPGLVGDSQAMAVSRDGSRILFAQALENPGPKITYVMTAWDNGLAP